MFVLVFKAF